MRGYVGLLGVTFTTSLNYDPIVLSTTEKVLPGFNFGEEVTSVEMSVRVP